MKLLFVFLAFSLLFLILIFPYIFRSYFRIQTNRLIYGHRPANEKQINRCISCLSWTNKWITSQTYDDNLRIGKLKTMLDRLKRTEGD